MSPKLVIGANGFLGSHVTRQLVQAGHQVRVMVRETAATTGIDDLDTERYLGDIWDDDTLRAAMSGCDDVYYCVVDTRGWRVDPAPLYRTNVEGTRNVLDALERHSTMTRLHYFSTCYVSGRYAGPFAEDDLDVGAPFNNYYEATKHLAEADVRRRMAAGMPATIYRPSIVIGDSTTGETQKYDGPYFILQLLIRQPRYAVLPVVGDPTVTRMNLVPRDFVIEAVDHLSSLAVSEGRTYQLADPAPLTIDELTDLLAEATDRKLVKIPLPRKLATTSVAAGAN